MTYYSDANNNTIYFHGNLEGVDIETLPGDENSRSSFNIETFQGGNRSRSRANMTNHFRASNNTQTFNGPITSNGGFIAGFFQGDLGNNFDVNNFRSGTNSFTSRATLSPAQQRQQRCIRGWLADSSMPNGQLPKNNDMTHMLGGGQWFRVHPAFTYWVKSASPCALWVRSPPGYGKTNLATRVANLCEGKLIEDTVVAEFFCKRTTTTVKEHEAENIMRRLLAQAAWSEEEKKFSECVVAKYNAKCKDSAETGETVSENQRPTLKECVAMLVAISKDRPIVFILDGLEQCEEKTREGVLRALHSVATHCCQPVKVMVSSRTERDIRVLMKGFDSSDALQITASLNRDSIDSFVESEVTRLHDMLLRGNMDPILDNRVVTTLKSGAHGNFSWVKSQLELLTGFRELADFERQLRSLAPAPNSVFDRWYRNVRHSGGEVPTTADAALCWLLYSIRPLLRRELLAAVSLTCNQDLMMAELNIAVLSTSGSDFEIWQDRPDRPKRGTPEEAELIEDAFDVLLKDCHGFLISDDDICWFSDSSARQYLKSKPEYACTTAESHIVKACLETYIAAEKWMLPYCQDLEDYARQSWPNHLSHLDDKLSSVLTQQIQKFHTINRRPITPLGAWAQSLRKQIHKRGGYLASRNFETEYSTQLIAATAERYYTTLSSGTGPHSPGPLEVLSVFGFTSFGVPKPSDPDELKSRCDLLCNAVEFDHPRALTWLLEQGIETEGRRLPQHSLPQFDDGLPPLVLATLGNRPAMVKILLEHGARTDVRDPEGNTPLISAAMFDDFESAGALLAAGADMNLYAKRPKATSEPAADGKRGNRMVAMHYAAGAGSVSTLRLLLAQPTADVDGGAGTRHGTPFIVAADYGQATAVNILLEAGATVFLMDSRGRTALWSAARRGYAYVVRLLLRRNAKTTPNSALVTPLAAAVAQGRGTSYEDIDIKSTTGRDALTEAILFDVKGEDVEGVSRADIRIKMIDMLQEALNLKMSRLNVSAAEDDSEESGEDTGESEDD